jgi:hypothetical protein
MKAANAGVVLLALAAPLACAQTSAVPPSRSATPADTRSSDVIDAVTATPTRIVEGAALGQTVGRQFRGAARTFDAAGSVGHVMTGTQLIIRSAEGYQQGGWEGAMREGGQVVYDAGIEYGRDRLGQAAMSGLFGLGTIGGTAVWTSGVLGWDAGSAIDKRYGNDIFNTWYPAVRPFTDHIDENSPQWKQKLDDDVEQAIRRRRMDKMKRDNEQQAQELQMRGPASTPSPEPSAAAALTQGIFDGLSEYQRSRSVVSTPSATSGAAARSCRLDPKTGCHPGHDEKSHPGGCKAC